LARKNLLLPPLSIKEKNVDNHQFLKITISTFNMTRSLNEQNENIIRIKLSPILQKKCILFLPATHYDCELIIIHPHGKNGKKEIINNDTKIIKIKLWL